jgi:3-oxoacyl-[acyl-carrier protein] reductase
MNVLITGSSRGIGAATNKLLREKGARVLGHGRADAPDQLGADLSQPGAAEDLWDRALQRLDGRIDVIINNAGIFEATSIDVPVETWREDWSRTLQTNLQASADLCRRAILHFRERGGGGRIVNVASRAAYRGDSPAHWHYAASKAGVVAMTKSIARGYANENILAFTVCPGFVLTGMADDYLASRGGEKLLADIPLGRVATTEEIAVACAFLALEAPPSMTGAVLDINGASFVR